MNMIVRGPISVIRNIPNVGIPGQIIIPDDYSFSFSTIFPYGIYRGANGKIIIPNFDKNNLIPYNVTGTANIYYVDGVSGSDGNAGTSWALAKKGIDAMLAAASYPCIIYVRGSASGVIYAQSDSWNGAVPGGSCYIKAVGGKAISAISWANNITITLDTGTTYTATRSNVLYVLDMLNVDQYGEWTPLTYVATKELCRATPGTWSDDSLNTSVWINRSDGIAVTTANTMCLLSGVANGKSPTSGDIFVEGISFIGGNNGAFVADGNASGRSAFANCEFKWAGRSSAPRDGLRILEMASAYIVNCIASHNSKDGFNITPTGAAIPQCVTIDCTGNDNGVSPSTSNNGLTYHGGAKGLDINGFYARNYGGNVSIINVNTQLFCIATHARDSYGDEVFGGTFPPTNWQAIDQSNLWLDTCYGGSANVREFSCNLPAFIKKKNHTSEGGSISGDGVSDY